MISAPTARISIHAPREGCDDGLADKILSNTDFNPRTPRGVRLFVMIGWLMDDLFQSTHPARGATIGASPGAGGPCISIHAPREGCDIFLHCMAFWVAKFQSTHPARGATANFTKEQRVCLAQFAYLHKGKKAEHTKTNAPMLH